MASFKGINSSAISSLAGWEEWNGSTWVAASRVPTVGDTAYANGFNKQIDQNWSVDEIRNNTFQGTTATGRFQITSAGITFNGARISQTVPVLFISYGSGTSTVNGTMTRNAGNTNTLIQGLAGGILNLENATNSTGDNTQGVLCENNGNGFIINVLNAVGANGVGSAFQYGLRATGNGYTINNNGVVQGGTASASSAIILAAVGNTFNNYGVVYGGTGTSGASGVVDSVGNTIVNYGIIQASAINPAISAALTIAATGGVTRVGTYVEAGVRTDSDQMNAVMHGNMKIAASPTDVQIGFKQLDNSTRNVLTASALTGYPLESKVEDGTVYGPSSEFEGTLEPWDATFAQALATAQRDLQLPSILSAITAP